MKKSVLLNIIAYYFILLFLYTGVAKLMEIHTFKEQLASSPLLGSLAGIITWALPIGELFLAIGLFIPKLQLKALYTTLILMSAFTIYVVVILFMDNQISCSCGGIIEELSPRQHVIFNTACVILSVVAIVLKRKQAPSRHFARVANSSVIILLLLLGTTLFTALTKPASEKTGMEGRLMPSINILLADSITKLNTLDIPTGKPFIVIGFSPYCIHCQAETRDILAHIQQFKDIQIYYITPWPFPQMKEFYKAFHLSRYSNITMGTEDEKKEAFFSYFHAPGTPYTGVFDAQKRLKVVFNGQADALKLAKAVTE